MNSTDSARHTYVPAKFLEFASIYYKHMGKIAEEMVADDRRITLLHTLFSISAALIEINDLSDTPIKLQEVVTRVLDTLFRGQRDEVVKCLEAMEKADLVKITTVRVRTFHKRTCVFTDKYVNAMREYTEEMCSSIANANLHLGNYNWIPLAQCMFDYFVFRYMPEWYLFLRRVVRSLGLPEEEKQELYDEIFASTLTWRTMTRYLTWAHGRAPEERARVAFRDYLQSIPVGTSAEPNELIRHLTKIGVCEIRNNLLLVHHIIEDDLKEFEDAVLADYEAFADTIHAMIAKFQPPRENSVVVDLAERKRPS